MILHHRIRNVEVFVTDCYHLDLKSHLELLRSYFRYNGEKIF